VKSKPAATGAAIWALAYAAGYVILIHQQGDSSVAWWYVALVVAAAAALVASVVGARSRARSILGAALLALAMLLGLASIGLLLLPAVATAGVAIATNRTEKSPAQADAKATRLR
jgi:hypothetical protein